MSDNIHNGISISFGAIYTNANAILTKFMIMPNAYVIIIVVDGVILLKLQSLSSVVHIYELIGPTCTISVKVREYIHDPLYRHTPINISSNADAIHVLTQ
jgi:hypothetical protein